MDESPTVHLFQRISKWWLEVTTTLVAAVSLAILQKFGDSLFDTVTNALGKTLLIQIASLLLFSLIYLGWKVVRQKREKPELIRVVAGVEFRRGDRTGRKWLPFCPNCHVAIYPVQHERMGFACYSGCGWHSPISADEIWKIATHGKITNDT
jgi:4-amino-4-deoxy-L-arabinose transferase-like glycosyltransferase